MTQPTVYLVGAGPGDYKLISVRGLELIQRAEVLVYDRLADERLLGHARKDAEFIYVGKASSNHAMRQEDINQLLVDKAKEGKVVVRLKGGDPFVFGRGGEEALTLIDHGVPFRIVPGITAGIGGLAYAGIPVTHREINHAVTFLTGHDSSGVVPDRIDWDAIGRGSPVIVMYMAMKHIATISANLIAAGRSADEPVAFVCDAATASQRVLETTLGRAEADVLASGLEPPAIVVVGEVVRLRPSLDWLGALSGRRLLPDPFASGTKKDSA